MTDADQALLARVSRSVTVPASLGSALVVSMCLAWVWGAWSRFAEVGLLVAAVFAINLVLIPRLKSRLNEGVIDNARWMVNFAATLAVAELVRWEDPAFALGPVLTIPVDGLTGPLARRRTLAGLLIFDGIGILRGGDPWVAGVCTAIGAMVYWVAESRVQVIREIYGEMLAKNHELEIAHRELGLFHDRAVAQEKMVGLGMLAAGIAHEINNPMAFITCNIECLERDLDALCTDAELKSEYANEVIPATINGIQRINGIVADLRRFARSDPEEMVPFELNSEVRSALRIARTQVKDRCQFELDLENLPRIVGRPRQISQVILNLLMNGAQAVPNGKRGQLRVTTRDDGEAVVMVIADNGSGMSSETQRRLFEPFFTTKPVGVGTGLGLSIVHEIVKSHRGRIEVQSEEGKGSAFTVRLPKAPPATGRSQAA